MRIDGPLIGTTGAGEAGRRLEEFGFDGAFTFEGPHDPFFPLILAARETERIELATAIAIAFARSPMLLANIGHDLQAISKGRFILGLGSQIKPHIEKRFSMPWSKPAARMRELVLAIRAIWTSWSGGAKLDFRGEFYQHTLMTPFFNPGPNPFGDPRIFLAGVGPRMTEVAGEVADGFIIHPFHTPESVRDTTLPALERGLAKAGRKRGDFEISHQVRLVSGHDDETLENADTQVRGQIAFYGSTPAYRGVLDSRGWGDLQPELNRLSKLGQWSDMIGLISDEVLESIAICGKPDELADKIRGRCAGVADRVSLVAAYAPDPEAWTDVVRDLKAGDA
ncbi:MAG: LLM class F420-dependent oxidoreductase [Myxococcota bacterium]